MLSGRHDRHGPHQVLIKLAATWEGIAAMKELEAEAVEKVSDRMKTKQLRNGGEKNEEAGLSRSILLILFYMICR